MTQNLVSAIPQKRWLHVIPVAVVMYMLAYLDRNNVSIILTFIGKNDPSMALSDSAKGMAAGIFFLGYMVLQIPGALLAQKWSAKKTVVILMVLWGFAAIACGMVRDETQLYVARFVLGVFEGGVWPACLVLLAHWFPLKERARANALWMICLPLSNMLMAPLTGVLLEVASWRTVFVIEGVPPLVWAIVWWFVIKDHPHQSSAISTVEREYVRAELAKDRQLTAGLPQSSYAAALRSGRTWVLIGIYFSWMAGFYGFSLWLPNAIRALVGDSPSLVGWLTAIPYGCALVGMLLVSRWSDKTGNRRLAVAVPMLVGLVVMVAGQWVGSPLIAIVALCVVGMGIYSPYGPFWVVPAENLPPAVLAFSIGLINALGNLGGFVGPYLVGWLNDATGRSSTGYYVLAGLLLVSVVMTMTFVKNPNLVTARREVELERV
ncbi:MAG: MFS transporter [Propionibacteriaceae bacterium]|nr:MFS transporter [Propionibacteriaceae bacterium]